MADVTWWMSTRDKIVHAFLDPDSGAPCLLTVCGRVVPARRVRTQWSIRRPWHLLCIRIVVTQSPTVPTPRSALVDAIRTSATTWGQP